VGSKGGSRRGGKCKNWNTLEKWRCPVPDTRIPEYPDTQPQPKVPWPLSALWLRPFYEFLKMFLFWRLPALISQSWAVVWPQDPNARPLVSHFTLGEYVARVLNLNGIYTSPSPRLPPTSRHQFKLNFHLPEDEHENEAAGLWYAAQTLGNLRPELV